MAHKVPTRVAYDDSGELQGWGASIDPDDEDLNIEELFKLYLHGPVSDPFESHPSPEEARRYFKDYMSELFKYIQQFFRDRRPRWESEKVEYLFSIPTTWRNPAHVRQIERLIQEAGFGRNETLRRVVIGATEAEAAAVCAAKGPYLVRISWPAQLQTTDFHNSQAM